MKYRKNVIKSQSDLKIISNNEKEILVKAKYGPSKHTRIPLILNKNISFWVASIIGDGHLRKDKKQISIELSNKFLISLINKISQVEFNRSFNVKTRIKNKKEFNYILMDSKAIYNFLNEVFKIPSCKKSHLVAVPDCIFKSKKNIKLAFLFGILATEGGKRKRSFGLSTASKELWEGLEKLFNECQIKTNKDNWIHKKYKKEYYGLSFKKEDLSKLEAGMPEWSNGMRLGDILMNFN